MIDALQQGTNGQRDPARLEDPVKELAHRVEHMDIILVAPSELRSSRQLDEVLCPQSYLKYRQEKKV